MPHSVILYLPPLKTWRQALLSVIINWRSTIVQVSHMYANTQHREVGCGALVECPTASPVMQASRARASLILLRYFRVLGLLLVVVPFTPPGEVIRDLLRLLHAVRMVWKH